MSPNVSPRLMRLILLLILLLLLSGIIHAAEPDFPLTADSQPQASVPKGELIKGSYTTHDGSVFPGTVRDYQIYLPAGLDKTQPAAFMVFQDGVIYQAPVVFDNLIAKKDIPPLVGIFIKPGIVPAANENALPRFNRSYEYDSITPTYSDFLIDEFLRYVEFEHDIKLSTDPNHAAISGNSSGGICAFMVAWHRPDRFRRVFTGVGTYVGIHGADQLPVLVRKFEPKPLRIFLQSGTGDNNLYCGDWWMANQMMERSLTWAGYDVNHAWGEGGHNAKHATQIFPEVLRWLWRDWPTTLEIKANPKNESKWKGYEVVGAGEWGTIQGPEVKSGSFIKPAADGTVFVLETMDPKTSWLELKPDGSTIRGKATDNMTSCFAIGREGRPVLCTVNPTPKGNTDLWNAAIEEVPLDPAVKAQAVATDYVATDIAIRADGLRILVAEGGTLVKNLVTNIDVIHRDQFPAVFPMRLTWSPDQTLLYGSAIDCGEIATYSVDARSVVTSAQKFYRLQTFGSPIIMPGGMCVDTNGWLYVATSLGIQVLDQAGRVNFILPTPKPALDVCFGGKDLSELFIACGDTIYKRPTKAKGIVSGQQPPIKPPPPKL